MNRSSSRFAKLLNISLVSFTLLTAGLQGSPVYALPAGGSNPPPEPRCVRDLQVLSFAASPNTVDFGSSTTLSWNVKIPAGCTTLKLDIGGQVVGRQSSLTVQPLFDSTYTLRATFSNKKYGIASASVKVNLPPIVTINANNLAPLLVQALRTPGTYIDVKNHVELNLSGRESIPIAERVTLAGGRTAREAGPRLYTTIRPKVLFDISGDNVRITGVRIEGPDHSRVAPEDEEPDKGIGILVYADINIEIDHNEIYGWSQAAVRVNDCDGKDWCPSPEGRMLPSENPNAVRIHDNYIHHNQHVGKNGYGVSMHDGAYALIERNVFDWNRHAIASAGSPGNGYAAYRNLVLKNGGYHDTYSACDIPNWVALLSPAAAAAKALCFLGIGPSYTHYTHQFDMHGTETCGLGHLDCGDGGHSIYIRHNTFLYTAGNAIKLRGIPEVGMFIGANVFAHDSWDDAVVQTEKIGAYAEPGNVFGVDASSELGSCDFDGDGLNDSFMATGATWWYSSGGNKPWVYLNTSTKRLSQVTLGFFDGDNKCDVSADGIIYPGGMPKKQVKFLPPIGGVLK